MCYFFMQKKILSIYLAVAIGFLSIVASAVPAYASNSTDWEDYFNIKYDSSVIDAPYTLEFKDSNSKQSYNNLSKDERRKVDYDAFSAISTKEQNYNYGDSILESTSFPELIKSIASAAGAVMLDGGYSAGINAEVKDRLTKISNSISASNRKFGGKGITRKSSSTHPNNFGLGTLTLSKDFINDLRSNVAQFDDYVIFPPANSSVNYYLTFIGASDIHDEFMSFFDRTVASDGFVRVDLESDDHDVIFYENTNYKNSYFYISDYRGVPVINHYDLDTYTGSDIYKNTWYYDFYKNSKGTMSIAYGSFTRIGYNYFVGRMNLYTKVFNSYDSLLKYMGYLSGDSVANYYVSNTTVNNDYSTTINKIYKYADSGCTETIQGNVKDAISDKGSALTDEEYQKIVDDVMKQVQEEIDSKEDTDNSGNTGGGTGGDSGNSGGGESDTWLEKIFNRLGDILGKIGTVTGIDTLVSLVQQIADDVGKLKNGEAIAPDMSVTNGLLSDISASLKTLIGVSAAGDISDLLADTVGDKISDYVGNVKDAVSEVTDALQEVFPFSIPWDLMAIFGLLSAESKAPEFDIPIVVPSLGINETFHIDFSDFEYISVICRTMLGISFAVGLMWITIELTKEGD